MPVKVRKHFDDADERLKRVAIDLNDRQRLIKSKIDAAEPVTADDLAEVQRLSEEHAKLMKQERFFTCEGCNEKVPVDQLNFMVVREVVLYDRVARAPRLHTLAAEIYINPQCTDCARDEELPERLGVVADSPAHLIEGPPVEVEGKPKGK